MNMDYYIDSPFNEYVSEIIVNTDSSEWPIGKNDDIDICSTIVESQPEDLSIDHYSNSNDSPNMSDENSIIANSYKSPNIINHDAICQSEDIHIDTDDFESSMSSEDNVSASPCPVQMENEASGHVFPFKKLKIEENIVSPSIEFISEQISISDASKCADIIGNFDASPKNEFISEQISAAIDISECDINIKDVPPTKKRRFEQLTANTEASEQNVTNRNHSINEFPLDLAPADIDEVSEHDVSIRKAGVSLINDLIPEQTIEHLDMSKPNNERNDTTSNSCSSKQVTRQADISESSVLGTNESDSVVGKCMLYNTANTNISESGISKENNANFSSSQFTKSKESAVKTGIPESSIKVLQDKGHKEKIKYRTLLSLKDKSKLEILKWCMDLGLICSRTYCSICGKLMKLKERPSKTDGFEWICLGSRANKHYKVHSVRQDSIFSACRLGILDILMIIHSWLYKVPYEWMYLEFSPSSSTLSEWTNLCRNICVQICAKDDTKIGGEDKVVEIVGKRLLNWKFGKLTTSWILIGVEDVIADKYFFKILDKCCKKSFLEVVKTSVLPGTTIVSEYYYVYNCIDAEDIVEMEAFYRYKFEDPNNWPDLEGKSWNVIKKKLPKNRKVRKNDNFDNYIAEYVWRKKNSNAYDKMRNFISAINIVFPTSWKDDNETNLLKN